jgi:YegS/Rv2252/BmrU family lipid kinase
MNTVAVVAHTGKSIGGGLPELRRVLARKGISDPLWYEVSKSRQAPKRVRRALKDGADLIFAWGGDGLAQRCINTLVETNATLAIVPAGTANLLATNLGIPREISAAVEVGLSGRRRSIDVGMLNGECFAVMAGVGLDARMIDSADGALKDTLGRISYVWTGARSLRAPSFRVRIKVDGLSWYKGSASCILFGNVGRLFGGIEVFEQAQPDDGLLELGLVSADGVADWARTIARTLAGSPEASPFVHTTRARNVKLKLSRKMLYELDGGARSKTKRLKIKVQPAAITIAAPAAGPTTPHLQERTVFASASDAAAAYPAQHKTASTGRTRGRV